MNNLYIIIHYTRHINIMSLAATWLSFSYATVLIFGGRGWGKGVGCEASFDQSTSSHFKPVRPIFELFVLFWQKIIHCYNLYTFGNV